MSVMVLGGTGQIGRLVCEELGDNAVAISRKVLDLRSDPLPLDNIDVIVDVSDNKRQPRDLPIIARNVVRSIESSVESGGNKLRVICLHVHGQHHSSYYYYRSKQQQHQVYAAADIDYTPVYATQFTTLLDSFFDATKFLGVIFAPSGARWQPVALQDVAKPLAQLPHTTLTIAGPETLTSAEAARRHSARRLIVPVPVPGSIGKFLRAGQNLAANPDIIGTHRYN